MAVASHQPGMQEQKHVIQACRNTPSTGHWDILQETRASSRYVQFLALPHPNSTATNMYNIGTLNPITIYLQIESNFWKELKQQCQQHTGALREQDAWCGTKQVMQYMPSTDLPAVGIITAVSSTTPRMQTCHGTCQSLVSGPLSTNFLMLLLLSGSHHVL